MIIEERHTYCDACGKEINGYIWDFNLLEFDEEGYPEQIGRVFCKECTLDFHHRWLKERRKTNPNKSPIDRK